MNTMARRLIVAMIRWLQAHPSAKNFVRKAINQRPWLAKVTQKFVNVRATGPELHSASELQVAPELNLTPELNLIVESEFFDFGYYSRATGLKFKSKIEAVQHYLLKGEANGYVPSIAFDPVFYKEAYPDLAYARVFPLLVHYVRHGRAEGRAGVFQMEELSSSAGRSFNPRQPTVVIAAHQASMTGVPILAYNIVEHFCATHNVVVLLLGDGPLIESFCKQKIQAVLVTRGAPATLIESQMLAPIQQRFGLDYVLVCTIEALAVATAAQHMQIPVVTLMHEFATYVFPKIKIRSMVEYSQMVLFSTHLTVESVMESGAVWPFRNYRVIHHGRSLIPSNGQTTSNIGGVIDRRVKQGTFLVVGCGTVEFRKGVDLFISAADQVTRRLGADKVQFIWIGGGYRPNEDFAYSMWLKDQIARSGLDNVVTILPATSAEDLEKLYARADAMFLSSRLDPFPNVAIDAMCAGLPVICFDRATGISEYLRDCVSTDELVVPYLDIAAAASALIRLVSDSKFKTEIISRIRSAAIKSFDMHTYTGYLRDMLCMASRMLEQEKKDYDILKDERLLSPDTMSVDWCMLPTEEERIRKYLRVSSIYPFRRPFNGFSPQIYIDLHPELSRDPYPNALAHWVAAGKPEGRWLRRVLDLGDEGKWRFRTRLKVALHLHLHYPEFVDDILRRIGANETRPDLFISITSEEGERYVRKRIERYCGGKVVIQRVPNRGRDVGPMITAFGPMLNQYDVIGHLHGKKSMELLAKNFWGSDWREFLFENLLGSKVAAMDEIMRAFEDNARLGMVFPEDPNIIGWTENYMVSSALCKKLGLDIVVPNEIEFPVGNMFYARSAALAPLLNSQLTWDDYPEEPVPYDGTMLHAIERLTPIICENQGYDWQTTSVSGIARH